MRRVSFTEGSDAARLSHCRKNILGVVVYDEYIEQGRLEWATVGDHDYPAENMINNTREFVVEDDKMLAEGRYVFAFHGMKHPTRTRIAIEKYEIRKKIFGNLYGFRAEISVADTKEVVGYMVSKSLSDLNAKVFGFVVQGLDYKLLDDVSSVSVMSSW